VLDVRKVAKSHTMFRVKILLKLSGVSTLIRKFAGHLKAWNFISSRCEDILSSHRTERACGIYSLLFNGKFKGLMSI
jgi:hypothetical protein